MFQFIQCISVQTAKIWHLRKDVRKKSKIEAELREEDWTSSRFFFIFVSCPWASSRHLLSFRSIPISAGVKTSLAEAKTSTYENKHTCCTCCTCHPLPNTASTHAQRWSVEKHSMHNKYSKEKHTHTYWTTTTIMYNYNERVGSCGRLPIFRTRRNDSEQTMI